MLRAGHGLVLSVVALLVFGVVMVQSAGLRIVPEHGIEIGQVLLGKPTILAGIALSVMFIAALIPVQRLYSAKGWLSPVPWIVFGSIALLLLVHVPGVGHEVNGARRWISVKPLGFQFQPSELAKWGLLIVVACYATRRAGSMHRYFQGFLPPMILIGVFCALIATEDLGTAVLIGTVSVQMLIAAGARLKHVATLVPIAGLGFIAAVMTSPYRIDRLKAFLNPYEDPQGIGYHIIQSMSAINGGGLAGRGLGNSVQKFGYLPEDTTDFIFAIICEELGLMGALVVVSLYSALMLFSLVIIRQVSSPFQKLLGLGIMLTLGLQALINIAVVTGSAPTKGIALPLLSAGGTGWIVTAFSIGLLVSMDRFMAREEKASLALPSEKPCPVAAGDTMQALSPLTESTSSPPPSPA